MTATRRVKGLKRLTVTKIRAAGTGWHHDGGGLYVFKATKDTGSYVYRYGDRRMGLGSIALVDLTEAREKAAECRKLRSAGIDPQEQRVVDRVAAQIEVARGVTFDECRERYVAAHAVAWRNAKHRAQWDGSLRLYASPVIGALPVSVIDVALVLKVLEPIWTAKPETARRLRERIEAVLDWARARDMRDGENPARWKGHLAKLLPATSKLKAVKHHAALPYDDLPAFMVALRAEDSIFARALELAILTAARGGEVRGAICGEIDLAEKTWTVPGERMKGGELHRVPLGPRALAIATERIAEAQKAGGDISKVYLFPGTRPGRPVTDMGMTAVIRRLGHDVTTHGFRSTFRDLVAERTNFPRELAEKALAHLVADEVERAYQRGDLFEKRRRLMDAWGSYATTPPREGVVVPMRGRTP
jgi:integrase